MARAEVCMSCTAGAGILSDRCERCEDFSAFELPCGLSLEAFKGLSAAGRLALVLIELGALRGRLERLEHDEG